MNDRDAIFSIASNLARQADLPDPVEMERLDGGKNNRVFRVTLRSGKATILKSYFSDIRDPRDRLGAEWAFIGYAWTKGIRNIPGPLAMDRANNSGLYDFIKGRKVTSEEIDESKIDAAITFIKKINAAPRNMAHFSQGSEACFTMGHHIATIDRRVHRLMQLDSEAPYRNEAELLITSRLIPLWRSIRETLVAACFKAGLHLDDELTENRICISPSDFGFHNALVDADGVVSFIDFEYAGLDDPAKLIADFFCQPEIPVPFSYYDRFADGLCNALRLGAQDRKRVELLIDPYRIKWFCIMLNDFLPADAARRAFSNSPDLRAARCAERLSAASSTLNFLYS